MQEWQWDRGRLQYFEFDNIKALAKCFVHLDGTRLSTGRETIDEHMQSNPGLHFRAGINDVWRNYKRVFERCLLATDVDGVLTATDLCRQLAGPEATSIDVDQYLSALIPRFYFPFPTARHYNPEARRVFPFCTVLKYLLATHEGSQEASISFQDICSLIIGNDCSGEEDLISYLQLPQTQYFPQGDHNRDVREPLIFISQSSFLKWDNNRLYLDVRNGDTESIDAVAAMAEPLVRERQRSQGREILALGASINPNLSIVIDTTRREPADVVFIEGNRARVTHLRAERSPYLRRAYFNTLQEPYLCDMCRRDLKLMYPWTDNILEIHHLLPLSSALTVTVDGTSLRDVVALCSNCHKSVHSYYKQWLNSNRQDDFRSKIESKRVYQDAKGQVRL